MATGSLFSKRRQLIIFLILLFVISISNLFAQSSVQTDVPALKDVFANDFTIGCLLSYAHIGFASDPYVPGQSSVVDPDGGYLIKHHMNSMSPGNWMKSTYIVDISGSAAAYSAASTQDEKDSIDVHPIVNFNGNIIAQLNWAQRQGFVFRGHTLIWHNQNPGTAFFRSGYTVDGTRLTKEQMTERMGNFIKEVIRIIHEGWPGLLVAMDVVNEAVSDNGTDRTSNNEYYTTFGDMSYVMKAFEFARQYTEQYGETQMKLYYNDYNTHISSKADGIVRVCQPIYEAGYLDGIGMQDHDQYNSPTAAQWIASYNKFYPICDEISVTELDVKPSSNTLTTSVLTTQANQYAMLFKCFLDRSYKSGRGKLINVSKDGLNDYWAFVDNASLWDADNQCKPAYYEVVELAQNYYSLDSLILVADSLEESDYTPESWSEFSTVLSYAKDAMDDNYSYNNSAADALGDAKDSLKIKIEKLVVTDIIDLSSTNKINDFVLEQNYPNPFNPSTTIRFIIPENSSVKVVIYNLVGSVIDEYNWNNLNVGTHEIRFNGSNYSSGIYFYKIKAGTFIDVKKMMLIK
jgi:endo-1,4-beta-xylanase